MVLKGLFLKKRLQRILFGKVMNMLYLNYYFSPLGRITLAANEEVLTGLWFEGQKYFGAGLTGEEQERLLPVFEHTRHWLDIYFQGKEPEFMPPLSLAGTDFQQKVWKILLTVPYGKTITYGTIAEQLAAENGLERMSAQAVGGAVGHNPISVIVPCHRVVGGQGQLTGYAGGIEKKERLLALEGISPISIHRAGRK